MNTRICLQIPPVWTVRVKIIHGYKKYILGGPGSQALNEIIDFSDRLFCNNTWFIDQTDSLCLERVKKNESDLTIQLTFYGDELDTRLAIPVPSVSMKTCIVSGHDLLKINYLLDHATALSNFTCFEAPVFLYLSSLLILFAFVVGIAVYVNTFKTVLIRRWLYIHRRDPHEFRVFRRPSNPIASKRSMVSHVMYQTWKGCLSVVNSSSSRFKWLSFLFSLLYLFVVESYNGIYSTSSIVAEERHIIKSYEQLIDDPLAQTYFYAEQSDSVSTFRNAHPNSLKGRVWRKLTRQPGRTQNYIIRSLNEDFFQKLQNIFMNMDQLHSVVITTTFSNEILSWLLCGCSRDGELRRMIKFIDPSEREKLGGWTASADTNKVHYFTIKLRRLIDSGLYDSLLVRGVRSGLYFKSLLNNSIQHDLEQSRVCIQESTIREASTVTKDVGYRYYVSTQYMCLTLLAIASLLLLIERLMIFIGKRKYRSKVKRNPRRRHRPPPFQL